MWLLFILISLFSGVACAQQTISSEKLKLEIPTVYSDSHCLLIQDYLNEGIDSIVLVEIKEVCYPVDDKWRNRKKMNCEGKTAVNNVLYTQSKNQILQVVYFDSVKIDQSRFDNCKILKRKDHEKLFKPLLAGDQKRITTMCYMPRHGMLFYGQGGRITGYLEICFECEESNTFFKNFGLKLMNIVAIQSLKTLYLAYGFEI